MAVGADYLAPYLGRMVESGKDARPPLVAEVAVGLGFGVYGGSRRGTTWRRTWAAWTRLARMRAPGW